jgi:hypothetical protein
MLDDHESSGLAPPENMSKAPSISNEPSSKPEPRVRRTSSPRLKKAEKSAKPGAETTTPAKFPEFPTTTAGKQDETATRGDWPEPEPATSGGGSGQENPKRKRRRKKGKGGGQSPANAAADHESADASQDPTSAPVTQTAQAPASQNKPPRVKIDSEQLAKFAWKIYLAEVSEEGVALVGDGDARELSRRCFRLAEIFLEEQARRR